MDAEVGHRLAEYFRLVGTTLSHREALVTDESQLVASLERLEHTREFVALAKASGQAFKRDDFDLQIRGKWEMHVQAFFRLSGAYNSLAKGDDLPVTEVQKLYCEAFESKSVTITYIAPLELVTFALDSIDFGQFQIRRCSRGELDALFQNSIRQVFYPWAAVDSSVLEEYWLLFAHETVAAAEFNDCDWNMTSRVGICYSEHPPAIQTAMRQLALFNWGSNQWGAVPIEPRPTERSEWDGPFLPPIPFAIRLSDSLIVAPTKPADLGDLSSEPIFVPETEEQVSEQPTRHMSMDAAETERFRSFLRRTTELLETIKPYCEHWRFVDTALSFLLKAYTTKGLEQLLWHMTAVEAVLGQQKKVGLTKVLSRRVSNILGTTAQECDEFRGRFKGLYSFRSDLVHGNADLADKEIYLSHLSEARDFARCVVVWMLHYLAYMAAKLSEGTGQVPSRDDLINAVDLHPDGCTQTARILEVLPIGFPNVDDWL
jgi:hypothetical protein